MTVGDVAELDGGFGSPEKKSCGVGVGCRTSDFLLGIDSGKDFFFVFNRDSGDCDIGK